MTEVKIPVPMIGTSPQAEWVRAMVRPGATFSFVGLFVGAFFTGNITDIPDWLRLLGAMTITHWFAVRPLEKQTNNGAK